MIKKFVDAFKRVFRNRETVTLPVAPPQPVEPSVPAYRRNLTTFDAIVDDIQDLFPYDLDDSQIVHNRPAEVYKAQWSAGGNSLNLRVSGADSFVATIIAAGSGTVSVYDGRYQDASNLVLDKIADVADEIGNLLRDVWSDHDSYGYADQNFVGVDVFEDQKGMAEILKRTGLPADWIVVKVVNFTDKSLKEQAKWLEENCEGAYRRVNWTESCATKLAVGFELGDDAVLYRLRWR
jgi:hypothetical protein